MFCCSGQKRPMKNNDISEVLRNDGSKQQLDCNNKSNRTNQQQDQDIEDEHLNQNKLELNFDVEDDFVKASQCPSFCVNKTSFQIFLMNIVDNQQINLENLPNDEVHVGFQDESSFIVSYPKIKEESLIEQISEESNLSEEDENDDKEMTEEEAKNAAIFKWAKETHDYCVDNNMEQIMHRVNIFKPIQSKEESRFSMAHDSGGKVCRNKKLVRTLRAIGKQLIKQIGRQILSGSLNLTTISFPIRAMIPKSALEKVLLASCLFPLYINRACLEQDPIERMKLLICATLGNFYINCSFLKPLNPILGETISGHYADGTKTYAEQISHHPPISYVLTIGPDKMYKFYGYYNYEAKAGLNSLSLKNKGKRFIEFANGQKIQYNFACEEYSGSFWGPMKVECKGKITFCDAVNEITASLEFDNVRWKSSDYLSGEIKVKGKRVSKIYGTYMGFIEFGDQRYWDVNYIKPYECKLDKPNNLMQSDASFRQDLRQLKRSKVIEAQDCKDQLEILQRQDGKLRKQQQQH